MAEQLIRLKLCDMHLAGDQPETEATETRTLPTGNVIDLCVWCAFYYDIFLSHREQLMWRMTDDAWERLMRGARQPEEARTPSRAAQQVLAAHRGQNELLEISSASPTEVSELEDQVAALKKELEALVDSGARALPADRAPGIEAAETLFTSESDPSRLDYGGAEPAPDRGGDGEVQVPLEKRRVLCVSCDPPAEMLYGSRSMHIKTLAHQGKGIHDLEWEGIGFEIPQQVGTRDPNVPSVVCPLKHQATAKKPYWVPIDRRRAHAESHGLHQTEIQWQNVTHVPLQARCVEHDICAAYDNGNGFPFADDKSVRAHVQSLARHRA